MATLIQSKQIEGIVTASVIDGVLVVSGSQILTGSLFVDGDITASHTIQANQFVGDGSRLTGVTAEGTGINILSGSIDVVATEVRFSGSVAKIDVVNSNTASIYLKSPYEFGGLFRTYETITELNSISVSYFSQGQIVYVVNTNSLYQADITYADFVTIFTDTITWNPFVFDAGASSIMNGDGLTKTYSGGVTTLGLDTGSIHFTHAVENIISSGSFMIDAGVI
jgi:hypothetical protein